MRPVITSKENIQALENILLGTTDLISVTPPWAPRMVVAMARVKDYTAAGCDISQSGALTRCAGEAAEIMAQSRALPDFMIAENGRENCPTSLLPYVSPDQEIFVEGRDLATGTGISVPASTLNYNITSPRPVIRSSGCAAGPTKSHALLSSLGEIAEHTSTTQWWNNNTKTPLSPLPEQSQFQFFNMLNDIRATNHERKTHIAQIDTLWGFHICVAWSYFRETKDGFMIASSADLDINQSAQSALRELIQLEWGLYNAISAYKDQNSRFSMSDQAMIEFSHSIKPDNIHIGALKIEETPDFTHYSSETAIKHIIKEFNINCIAVDLHEEPGICVTKAVIPSHVCNFPPFL